MEAGVLGPGPRIRVAGTVILLLLLLLLLLLTEWSCG